MSPTGNIGILTSKFGPRTSPISGTRAGSNMHLGVDIGVPIGTKIVSPAEVEIMHIGLDPDKPTRFGFGKYVIMYDKKRDKTYMFNHLSDWVNIHVGKFVGPGTLIALSGNGGTGPHLDVRVMDGKHKYYNKNATIDPLKNGFNYRKAQ